MIVGVQRRRENLFLPKNIQEGCILSYIEKFCWSKKFAATDLWNTLSEFKKPFHGILFLFEVKRSLFHCLNLWKQYFQFDPVKASMTFRGGALASCYHLNNPRITLLGFFILSFIWWKWFPNLLRGPTAPTFTVWELDERWHSIHVPTQYTLLLRRFYSIYIWTWVSFSSWMMDSGQLENGHTLYPAIDNFVLNLGETFSCSRTQLHCIF